MEGMEIHGVFGFFRPKGKPPWISMALHGEVGSGFARFIG
jgi:hypothetical protein